MNFASHIPAKKRIKWDMSRFSKKTHNQTKEKENSARELIVESLKLPRDTVMGASIVTVIGKEQVLVENYRGILEYTKESIVLQGKTCRIAICGCRLSIAYYTNEDMKIEGNITQIRYL